MYRSFLSDLWWLRHIEWQWLATFTFARRVSRQEARGRLIDWLRELQKDEHMQVGAAYYYVVQNNHTHFHVVLIGSGTRNGSEITLADIDPAKWENAWSRRRVLRGRNRPAVIEVVESSEGASQYLARHNFEWKSGTAEFNWYNGRLLERFFKPPLSFGRKWQSRNYGRLQNNPEDSQ